MAFRCPYCAFSITVKTPPKPGKYSPKCPKCQAKIALTVTEGDAPWRAEKVPGENPIIPQEDLTLPAPSPSSPPKAKAKPQGFDPDATQAPGESIAGHEPDDTETTSVQGSDREPVDSTGVYESSSTDVEDAGGRTAMYTEGSTRIEEGNGATIAHTSAATEEQKPKKKKGKPVTQDTVEIPDSLGGYEVVKELGRGGMGAVFLARQVSLDRPVALKVMNSRWASDPVFLARFTREAFAAAQLVHHNVVQIYDIGEQDAINFFSMEFVEGKSLGDLLKKEGKLPLESAIGYVLQAARGLKFAHDRGMVHRDIKPDNLMLNVHGIVKVADLGLVKTPTMNAKDDSMPRTEEDMSDSVKSMSVLKSMASDITLVNTAMGSPSYMSPEQCKNAASVDHRADIYSLGCTLYALLSGKPPFSGNTVFDVMAKHATEPVKPLADMPKNVNTLIQRSLAKSPGERYASMDEFIVDLEQCLPGKLAGKPTEEHLTALENAVQTFQASSAAKLKQKIMMPLFAGGMLASVLAFFFNGYAGFGLFFLTLQTVLAYFVISGVLGKTYVFRKVREFVFGARITDWLIYGFGLIVFVVALFLISPVLLGVWVGSAVGAAAIGFVLHVILDKRAASQRENSILDTQKLLKRLRLNGMEEDELRLFVAKNAGANWEEYFETLFGYEAKIAVRPEVQALFTGEKVPVFAGWRDSLITRCDKAIQQRKEAKTLEHLKSVEVKKLQAEGLDARAAAERATAAAEVMVEQAAEIKTSKKPVNINKMMASAERGMPKRPRVKKPVFQIAVNALTDYKLRFLVAASLILLGALWVKDTTDIKKIAEKATQVVSAQGDNAAEATAKQSLSTFAELFKREKPSDGSFLKMLPFVDSLNVLVAGLVLFISILINRPPGILLCALAAIMCLILPGMGVVPDTGPIEGHQVIMATGFGMGIFAFLFFRGRSD